MCRVFSGNRSFEHLEVPESPLVVTQRIALGWGVGVGGAGLGSGGRGRGRGILLGLGFGGTDDLEGFSIEIQVFGERKGGISLQKKGDVAVSDPLVFGVSLKAS